RACRPVPARGPARPDDALLAGRTHRTALPPPATGDRARGRAPGPARARGRRGIVSGIDRWRGRDRVGNPPSAPSIDAGPVRSTDPPESPVALRGYGRGVRRDGDDRPECRADR